MKQPQPRPLDHITVVSLEHAIAAPFCTRQLADLGARVIKIERPVVGDFARQYDQRVDGMSSHFTWTNRSKESLTLDLKHEACMEILLSLIKNADVFVQNLAPGATERLGLTADTLRNLNPKLIVCNISGYGGDGPYRDKKAYDLLIQSEAGFLSVTGTAEDPVKAGCSIADISAGMYAYTNILSALLMREKTGVGSDIDLSMLESLSEWMSFPLYYAYNGAEPPPRSGASHATIYPYGPFRVGDGTTVLLGLQNEREWQIFCEKVMLMPQMFEDPQFDSNTKRHEQRAAIQSAIEQCFSALNIAQVEARLDDAKIANARMNTMNDVWEHPQLRARSRWQTVGSPVGDVPALLPPGVNSAFTYNMQSIPSVGEHTDAILKELGLSGLKIGELRQLNAV